MNTSVKSVLFSVGRYLLGIITTLVLFFFFFSSIVSKNPQLTGKQGDLLFIFLTLTLPLLYVWKFWKGGLTSVLILFLLNQIIGGGRLSTDPSKLSSDCISETKAKRIIGDYYDERFAAQSITWFSNQWLSEKKADGTVTVTAYYNSDYCQPACKEMFEVACDGTYRVVGIDFSTNPNTEN